MSTKKLKQMLNHHPKMFHKKCLSSRVWVQKAQLAANPVKNPCIPFLQHSEDLLDRHGFQSAVKYNSVI